MFQIILHCSNYLCRKSIMDRSPVFVTIFHFSAISKTCNLFMNHNFFHILQFDLCLYFSFATVIRSESLTFLLSVLIYQPLNQKQNSRLMKSLRPFSRAVTKKTRLDIFHLNSFKKTFRANRQEIQFCLFPIFLYFRVIERNLLKRLEKCVDLSSKPRNIFLEC